MKFVYTTSTKQIIDKKKSIYLWSYTPQFTKEYIELFFVLKLERQIRLMHNITVT